MDIYQKWTKRNYRYIITETNEYEAIFTGVADCEETANITQ